MRLASVSSSSARRLATRWAPSTPVRNSRAPSTASSDADWRASGAYSVSAAARPTRKTNHCSGDMIAISPHRDQPGLENSPLRELRKRWIGTPDDRDRGQVQCVRTVRLWINEDRTAPSFSTAAREHEIAKALEDWLTWPQEDGTAWILRPMDRQRIALLGLVGFERRPQGVQRSRSACDEPKLTREVTFHADPEFWKRSIEEALHVAREHAAVELRLLDLSESGQLGCHGLRSTVDLLLFAANLLNMLLGHPSVDRGTSALDARLGQCLFHALRDRDVLEQTSHDVEDAIGTKVFPNLLKFLQQRSEHAPLAGIPRH